MCCSPEQLLLADGPVAATALRPGPGAVVGVDHVCGSPEPLLLADGPVTATRAPPGPKQSGQSGSAVPSQAGHARGCCRCKLGMVAEVAGRASLSAW
jgi:hypothetical protein